MRDRVFTIVLALLLVALLILAPRHPFSQWRVPCVVFCVLALLWLAPELWAMRPRKRKLSTNYTNSHKLKRGGRK